ncbi:polysaccharide deacetylase family protein [Caldalkalibacillus salinus]|uniref:polysaccharide deacetylase family protein n=1 Tax=Caldalkalibacillus salinus TaxID=2803787 RepID=UPI001F008988|nr:polysaccharide deacetylase family protein [Caldalkalibacillus salinus]
MRLKVIFLMGYILIFAFILTIINQSPIDTYISAVKMESVGVSQKQNDTLYREVESLAQQVTEAPVNARIDKVWKGIPGYNGLEVDVDKTYRLAQQLGEIQLQDLYVNEIEPDVTLDDLPVSPIYRGNAKKPMVSIMVNVAWGTEYVLQMLEVFEQYNVRATFFLDGSWLKKNPEVGKRIVEGGHEVGNHAYSHPDMSQLSISRIREELVKTNELIEELGTSAYVFAPPSGAYDERVVKEAHELNMKTILWTLDTIDWQKPPAHVIVDRIVPRLENGALILSHPTASTVEALPQIIESAMEKEFMVGTVSQLISPSRTLSVVSMDEL